MWSSKWLSPCPPLRKQRVRAKFVQPREASTVANTSQALRMESRCKQSLPESPSSVLLPTFSFCLSPGCRLHRNSHPCAYGPSGASREQAHAPLATPRVLARQSGMPCDAAARNLCAKRPGYIQRVRRVQRSFPDHPSCGASFRRTLY